jgi:hypothetical protein
MSSYNIQDHPDYLAGKKSQGPIKKIVNTKGAARGWRAGRRLRERSRKTLVGKKRGGNIIVCVFLTSG